MKEIIAKLYPEYQTELLAGIQGSIAKYNSATIPKSTAITHEDCVLITYGDAIFEKNRAPLESLCNFAKSYLKEGVTAIHLLPCFPYTSDDGFSVVNYYEIDPDLGNWSHIERLNAHFDLMFDAVVNHMSKSSKWFQLFLEGKKPYDSFFIEVAPNLDYSKVIRPRALPLFHPFKKNGEATYVWTTFSEDQVDLNYQEYHVFLQILDVLLFYISKGAKYIRLDAIAFLWKKIGTTCIHLDETHMVIQAYRQILDRVAPEAIIITETNVPHIENISYFGNGSNEAHMVYNFTLPPLLAYAIHNEDVSVLADWAKSLVLPSDETCFFNFTASHDGIGVRPLIGIVSDNEIQALADITIRHGGFVSYKDNGDGTKSPYELNCNYMDLISDPKTSREVRMQRFLLTQSVMLCMPGVPGIYYHSILGSSNDIDGAENSGIPRRINREKLPYDTLKNALEDKKSFRSLIYNNYMQLLSVRRSEVIFNPYGSAMYHRIEKVFIIERSYKNETLYAVHNFSSKSAKIKAIANNVLNLVTQTTMETAYWSLDAFSFLWLKKQH